MARVQPTQNFFTKVLSVDCVIGKAAVLPFGQKWVPYCLLVPKPYLTGTLFFLLDS